MSDEGRGRHSRPDDETRPVDLGPVRPLATDPEPAVAAALDVVQQSLASMANRATRPLLDAPPQPFRLRPVGATGLAVFPVVLDVSRLGEGVDRTAAHRALDAYGAAGGNALAVDDAADGSAAQLAGAWLANRGRREQTVLVGRIGRAGGLTAAGVLSAVERLLQRLGVPRLDLLVLADHDPEVAMEETLTAAAGLLDADRVGHLAAGDHRPDRLMQARVLAGQRGLPRFEAVAPVHSLMRREAYERVLAPVVHAQQLATLPRSPLAGGFLAAAVPTRGALRRLRELDPGRAERLQPSLTRRGMRVVDAVVRIAGQRDVPPAAVALAWLLTRPHVAAPIVSATTVEQVWAVTAAAGVHLSRAEVTALERASADERAIAD
ncbi:aldo/keto reductase [uncultured Amnibacterium sp.]|uniref:aldo/keto reductase n=1 Tax=uncultured Amnibacterium sp. TaxID=1631851 RepID=UPI0035CAF5B1